MSKKKKLLAASLSGRPFHDDDVVEPSVDLVLNAAVAVAKRGLLRSFETRHRNGVLSLKMTLHAPRNDVDHRKIEEFEARAGEYKAAWADWKSWSVS